MTVIAEMLSDIEEANRLLLEFNLKLDVAGAGEVLIVLQSLISASDDCDAIALAAARYFRWLSEAGRMPRTDAAFALHSVSRSIATRRLHGVEEWSMLCRELQSHSASRGAEGDDLTRAVRDEERRAIVRKIESLIDAEGIRWYREIGEVGLATQREQEALKYRCNVDLGEIAMRSTHRHGSTPTTEKFDFSPWLDSRSPDELFAALMEQRGTVGADEALLDLTGLARRDDHRELCSDLAQKLRQTVESGGLSSNEHVFILDAISSTVGETRLEDDPVMRALLRESKRIEHGLPRGVGVEGLPWLGTASEDRIDFLITFMRFREGTRWLDTVGERALAMMRRMALKEYFARYAAGKAELYGPEWIDDSGTEEESIDD